MATVKKKRRLSEEPPPSEKQKQQRPDKPKKVSERTTDHLRDTMEVETPVRQRSSTQVEVPASKGGGRGLINYDGSAARLGRGLLAMPDPKDKLVSGLGGVVPGPVPKAPEPMVTETAEEAPEEIVREGEFLIGPRKGITKVSLSPRVKVSDTGVVTGISFGRTRTPSPFTGRMGDHTVAWASVVDSVHSALYGLHLDDAVKLLREKQEAAQAWMSREDSPGMLLWRMLPQDDRVKRRPRLEGYADTVAKELAGKPDRENLQRAISHHLAFLNLLPNATVQTRNQTLSKSKAEGIWRGQALLFDLVKDEENHRAAKLQAESSTTRALREADEAALAEARRRESPPAKVRREKAEKQQAALELQVMKRDAHEGLRKLFDMEAAVRAADVDRVIAPTRAKELADAMAVLKEHVTKLQKLIPAFVIPPVEPEGEPPPAEPGQKTRKTPRKAIVLKLDVSDEEFAKTLREATAGIAGARDLLDVHDSSSLLADKAEECVKLLAKLKKQPKVKAGDSNAVVRNRDRIRSLTEQMDALTARLTASREVAMRQAATVLGKLVHDHQTTIALAYPESVKATKFLSPSPAEQAVGAIRNGLAGVRFKEPAEVAALLKTITEMYPSFGPAPKEADRSEWVAESQTESLVVSTNKGRFEITGRPAAPPGVGGMGSHTTAWVDERTSVNGMLLDVTGKEEQIEVLRKKAEEDLTGTLMTELAAQLPAEQLDGGQLGLIFDEATELMGQKEPEDAVKAFLNLRNLLPYATVDAGSRAGRGERAGKPGGGNFDGSSLRAAIDLKAEELTAENILDTAASLTEAARSLQADLDDMADSGEPRDEDDINWKSSPVVKRAVIATIAALQKEASRLDGIGKWGSGAKIPVKIYDRRRDEDGRVSALAAKVPAGR